MHDINCCLVKKKNKTVNRLRAIIFCNSVVLVLALIYCFVSYTREMNLAGYEQVQSVFCKNAFSDYYHSEQLYCSPSARLAEINFVALLTSAVITAAIFILDKFWKAKGSQIERTFK